MIGYSEIGVGFQDSSPISLMVTNSTKEVKNIKLFAPGWNSFENENVESAYQNIDYSFIQKTLLKKDFDIGLIRMSIFSKKTISKKAAIKFFSSLIILVKSKNVHGFKKTNDKMGS